MSEKDKKGVAGAWQVLSSDELYRNRYFAFRRDTCRLPDARIMPAYYVWEMHDWVNVVALRRDGRLIVVNQYRHAAGDRFVEFPGGTTEPGSDESPEQAARRELLEETGYAPGELRYVGMHYPNPGLQDNRMHVFLAVDCERVSEPQLDPFEDLEVEVVTLGEFLRRIGQGQPMNSLMMASLTLALPAIKSIDAAFASL